LADPLNAAGSTPVEQIVTLIKTLRGDNGCPWDKKQTPDSMTRYLVEEVYELADAIISGDADAVCEEAGDVLFQLLFVIHLFGEAGHFRLQDVVEKNVAKMVRRHPHVFGDVTAKTAEKVSENWQKIKQAEKRGDGRRSVLGSIPQSLPALLRASIVSERAAKTGFDWDNISGVMAKTMEEWAEFSKEIHEVQGSGDNDKTSMEFGDILFTLVNVARFARIHPETALIRSIQKFEKRFAYMEDKSTQAQRDFDSLSPQEMNALWEEAKRRVG
jgi:tetrapyrrole methylase family protein/MazG family protein